MRYFIYLFLPFLLFSDSSLVAQNKPLVVATASMIADMAKNIAGDKLDIQLIVPIGGDPHIYDPTPRDAQLVTNAQLVLRNGLTFEGWLNELIENSGTEAAIVTVTKGISAITSQKYKSSTDPHAWMDVSLAIEYCKNIRDAFIHLDPTHQSDYEANYEDYAKQLQALDRYVMEQIASIPETQRILITSHDAFQYYGRRYHIRLEAILGTSTDAEAQTSDIIRINNIIRESKVPAVFIESTINPKLLKQLASDNDIEIGGELYADSIGDEDSPAPTYIDMLRHNTDVIVKALSRKVDTVVNEEGKDSAGFGNIWLFGLLALLFLGGFFLVSRKMNNR